jgi:anti-sigma factor RsiW
MRTVDHVQAEELFSSYWDEELDPETQRALEEHLETCVVCRREYQAFETTLRSVEGLHRMSAPPHLTEGVKDRIRKRSKGRFFAPRKLAERVPYEIVSLLMLGLLLAVYVALQLAQPAQLRLP